MRRTRLHLLNVPFFFLPSSLFPTLGNTLIFSFFISLSKDKGIWRHSVALIFATVSGFLCDQGDLG